jgi:hypothetical protein
LDPDDIVVKLVNLDDAAFDVLYELHREHTPDVAAGVVRAVSAVREALDR